MKKNEFLVLQNHRGETARVMPYTGEELLLVYRHDNKRIEVVRNTDDLEENQITYDTLSEINKSSEVGDTLAKGAWGQLKHVQKIEKVAPEAKEKKEDDRRDFFFFLKWTSAIQVSALILILLGSWAVKKFFTEDEPQIVKVFKREDLKLPTPTVAVSKKPIEQKRVTEVFKNRTTKIKKVAVRKNGKTNSDNIRSGNDLKKMGALSAFGGMSPNSTGLGGLNKSPSNSAGFAFDSSRARGGSARGMLGKGLVQAGIGGGESLQGYGGYGTSGKGQGQAGYGSLSMAGRAGGFHLPLSEDASIEGGLDRDQINAVVRRNQGQVLYCYERGLQSEPGLSGRVAVKFVISPSGNVSTANVAHTSLDSKNVESCIVTKLRGWKFPRPKGNVAVKVEYPFMLKRLNQG